MRKQTSAEWMRSVAVRLKAIEDLGSRLALKMQKISRDKSRPAEEPSISRKAGYAPKK